MSRMEEFIDQDSQNNARSTLGKNEDFALRFIPSIDGAPIPIYLIEHPIAKRILGLTFLEKDLERSFRCIELIPAQTEKIIIESLWLSAVGFYARCFVSGDRPRLEDTHLRNLSPELKKMHDETIHMRHTHVSHAEGDEFEKGQVQAWLNPDVSDKRILHFAIPGTREIRAGNENLSVFAELIGSVINVVRNLLEKAEIKLKEKLAEMPIDELYNHAILPTLNNSDVVISDVHKFHV
jgi:hypothetical protein